MSEDQLIEVAQELRRLTVRAEAMVQQRNMALQRGELFVNLDGRIHLPMIGEACDRCGILKTKGHMCGSCGQDV